MTKVKASAAGHRTDPQHYVFNKLRDRLRHGLRAVVTKKSSLASQRDHHGIRFLLWAAGRQGVDPLSSAWQIDHLRTAVEHDLSTDKGRNAVNHPGNIRWLTREQNASRGDTPATHAELRQHEVLLALYNARST